MVVNFATEGDSTLRRASKMAVAHLPQPSNLVNKNQFFGV